MEAVLDRSSIVEMGERAGADVRDMDAQLMVRFKEGNTEAFDTLFRKHLFRVVNFAYRFVRNRAVAEELAQDIFLKVYENAGNYAVQAKFTTWLYTIATNVCLNEVRRPHFKAKHQSLYRIDANGGAEEEIGIEAETTSSPDALLERQGIEDAIKSALEHVPEKQRIAFILNKYQELSYAEVAEVLEVSEKAVKSLIHRAKEALALKLKPWMPELLSK